MSRSYKKTPIRKIRNWLSKRAGNRKYRRINKQRLSQGLDPLPKKAIVNPYELVDWIHRFDDSWRYDCMGNKRYNEEEFNKLKRHMINK